MSNNKYQNKHVRQQVTENPAEQGKPIRQQYGRQLKLDASAYERAHPGKKLMWIADYNGGLDWWLANEAEPVPRNSIKRKVYPGLNDKAITDYVSVVGGVDDKGNVYNLVLLMIDPDLYEELKTGPEADRIEEISASLRMGQDSSGMSAVEKHLKGGGSMKTYAPNLPVGEGQGFNEIRPRQ